MGIIEIIAKYDLANQRWDFSPKIESYGRSFHLQPMKRLLITKRKKSTI